MLPFLLTLATQLTEGLQTYSPARKQLQRDFILSLQSNSGAFVNRYREDDLYYSSFALRALQLLGDTPEPALQQLIDYLKPLKETSLSTIDRMNWLQMAIALQSMTGFDLLAGEATVWIEEMLAGLENCRSPDCGYAKSPEGALGSTYHTFLTLLIYELLNRPVPNPQDLVRFLRNQQRDDGGFVEIAPMNRSGTNPTAAAVVSLARLNALNEHDAADVSDFLKDVWSQEGGFAANTRIPFPDSLSTFTALITLDTLSTTSRFNLSKIQQWVSTKLEFPTGGFRAAEWDDQADLEYTFYGLGCLALTSPAS
jgi:geranylgeranyl transferase type-2 subunit beta